MNLIPGKLYKVAKKTSFYKKNSKLYSPGRIIDIAPGTIVLFLANAKTTPDLFKKDKRLFKCAEDTCIFLYEGAEYLARFHYLDLKPLKLTKN